MRGKSGLQKLPSHHQLNQQRKTPALHPCFGILHMKLSLLMLIAVIFTSPLARAADAQLTAVNPQLVAARTAYFKGVEGDTAATTQARHLFETLRAQYPASPLVEAYEGSLDLLESGRSLRLWAKHDLAQRGLDRIDKAVADAPEDLEVRFIRAVTTWHLPFFFRRRQQAEDDFSLIAPRVESAAQQRQLPPFIAAAALDYHGQILAGHSNNTAAQSAFRAAIRIAPESPAAKEAARYLR